MQKLIIQRETDGYLFTTRICQKYNKLFADYARLETTKQWISRLEEELKNDMGIPISFIITVRTGQKQLHGSYIHPSLISHFAQWVSVDFAFIMHQRLLNPPPPKVYAFPRHATWNDINENQIPYNYFAVAGEFLRTLGKELYAVGYALPECIAPEVSVGRTFVTWFKKENGFDIDFKLYAHICPSGYESEVRMYHQKYLVCFKTFVLEVWLPQRAWKYFSERDQNSLQYLDKLVSERGLPAIVKPSAKLEI